MAAADSHRMVLLTPVEGLALDLLREPLEPELDLVICHDAQALARAPLDRSTTLIAYGTGVIVTPGQLEACAAAYNFHGAPPAYPGRDPHHFAAYDGVRHYGATAHVMTPSVDAGPIVGVERIEVEPDPTAARLLGIGQAAMLALYRKLAPAMAAGEALPVLASEHWGERKTTRADFLALCQLDALVDADELARRERACQMPGHDNLVLELHGRRFFLEEGTRRESETAPSVWQDFTETGYERLVRTAMENGYRFARFAELADGPIEDRHVLWRHDVDLSPQRARRLAAIEHGNGVKATYFVNPRARSYSLMDPDVTELFREIHSLGHDIGLHFDSESLALEGLGIDALEEAVEREAALVERMLGCEVTAFSWHNPEAADLLAIDRHMAGRINAYARDIRDRYRYVSDSNGLWRFDSAFDIIAGSPEDRLHVLTHPAWWTPEPMPPRARVLRAMHGRASRFMAGYDAELLAANRPNRKH